MIPYEGTIRAWLARARVSEEDVDDIVQEGCCRLAALDNVDHIARPGAYFFSIFRNLLLQRIKRCRIVSIDMIAEIETFAIDDRPSPEREAAGRLDYARLRTIMAGLPDRCRRIVEMLPAEADEDTPAAPHTRRRFLIGGSAANLKLSLDLRNLFDSYRRVALRDGSVPLGYRRDEIDPLGRTLRLTVRKRF
ncbi:sigma-70 family RNA polymerase sigma factor [Sphingomonas sp. HF-S4]|uniref:Sigma-70 family RNA polymerase sigma factor n=1 Tax=Sphingomonas agrestis TaxID=3080540 RepID=A0ABU3Y547_9SPHN|nr:sigma-70 family RNA polymerase sigma factor [Sphingomonas sp. HF-S4]MDV3456177.1 sigma-70 family RNA polymerase sigma factor [Sphingomonas sp. HF-S4]